MITPNKISNDPLILKIPLFRHREQTGGRQEDRGRGRMDWESGISSANYYI